MGGVTQLSEFLPIADQAVDLARQVIHEHRSMVVTAKGDRDMVSEIDLKIERVVRAFLQLRTPEIGFMGEEEGSSSGTATGCSTLPGTQSAPSGTGACFASRSPAPATPSSSCAQPDRARRALSATSATAKPRPTALCGRATGFRAGHAV
jgi:3'-phosphoadenosine 5'-phosphosulfate (PAPS) 3'-phosphatase